MEKIYVGRLYTKLFYIMIIPIFSYFLLFCYQYTSYYIFNVFVTYISLFNCSGSMI